MNYGYNTDSKFWDETRKLILADELRKVISRLGLETGKGNDGVSPYIEVDGLYDGVRIRRITYLSEERQIELVKECDRIYDLVMLRKIRE